MVTHHILHRLGIYCLYLVPQNWRDPIGPLLYFLPLPDISMTHLTDVGRKNDLVHLTFFGNEQLRTILSPNVPELRAWGIALF